MSPRDIRIVDLGDGTAVWVAAGDPPEPPPPAPRRRWALWAAVGVALTALGGAAVALLT